jgi:CRP-like cAMP-binding protein
MDLRSVGLLAGLPDRDLDKIAQQVREVHHTAGAEITVQGREGVGFLMILDGQVEVRTPNFKSFLLEHPEVAYRLLQLLSRRVREAEAW